MNPKSVSLILYIALISLQLNEQEKNCTDETILGKKGIWKQSDFITSFYESRNKEKYGEAQKIVSNIADIFINLIPEPAGMEPKWWGSERNPVIPGGPLAYDFNSDYLKYFCAKNTNELLLGFETGTWIYAHINSGGYVFQMYDTLEIKGKPELIYQLPKRAGTWEGHTWFLQPDIGKHSALGRSVILHRPGEVPYHILTQKEFLLGLKKRLEGKKEKQIRLMDDLETELANNMEKLNDFDNLKSQFMENYRKELEKYKQNKSGQQNKLTGMFDAEIFKIENYLSTASAKELGKPAITGNGDTFSGFFDRENEFAQLMVRYNTDYFKKDLPLYVPQFMVLLFRYDVHPAALQMKKIIDDNFPLQMLEDMIDNP